MIELEEGQRINWLSEKEGKTRGEEVRVKYGTLEIGAEDVCRPVDTQNDERTGD